MAATVTVPASYTTSWGTTACSPDGSEEPSSTAAEHWAWDLVNDLLRLTGGAA